MELALTGMARKWTEAARNVHRKAQSDGQRENHQLIDFVSLSPCPFGAYLRVKIEGTLPRP